MRAPNGKPGTPAEENPDGLIPITLFPNDGEGYGDGITYGFDTPRGYDRTINMTVREGRVLSPSFSPNLINFYGGVLNCFTTEPRFLLPWQTSAGVPFALTAAGEAAFIFTNGANIAGETDATANIYWDGCQHDDGAGVAQVYTATVTSYVNQAADNLNRRTQAGTWSEDADVNAKLIASGAGALWRATSDYQISKCPAGSEPFTIGNWGAAIQVGTNEAKMTRIGMIGAAPIVGKEDGIYKYIEADNRFENVYRVPLHKDNFPFMAPDGAGGLFTSTVNGDLVNIQQFGAIVVSNPLGGKYPGRDTPVGQIRTVCVDGEDIYAVLQTAAKKVREAGLKVLKTADNFGTFTDYSDEVLDDDYASVADISSLDTLANGDALLVGFDEQFLGVDIVLAAANTVGTTLQVAFSTGAGTWTAVATGSIVDGTGIGETSEIPMARNGVVAIQPTDVSTWVEATYDGHSKYWWRISRINGSAFDASTTIALLSLIVKRAAPDFTTTNYNQSESWAASGMFAELLRGKRRGDDIIWDHLYTLPSVGDVGVISATTLPTANSPSSSLLIVNRDASVQLPLPNQKEPSITSYPKLARDTTVGANPAVAPVYYPSAVDLGDLHELRYIHCEGENFTTGTDGWGMSFRGDETNPWEAVQTQLQGNVLFEVTGHNQGTVLHTAFQILDGAATDPIGPTGRRITAWVKPLDDHPALTAPQRIRSSPETS